MPRELGNRQLTVADVRVRQVLHLVLCFVSRSRMTGGRGPTPMTSVKGEGAGDPTPHGPLGGSQSTRRRRRVGLVALIAGVVCGAVGIVGTAAQVGNSTAGTPAAAVGTTATPSATIAAMSPLRDPQITPPPAAATTQGSPATKRSKAAPITVPNAGPGTYLQAKLDLDGRGSGRVIRYDVRVERGLNLDPKAVAREIHRTLSDKRSWRGVNHVRFQLVSNPAKARLHAYLVTPKTTDRLCYPWLTRGQVSCQIGTKVVLNAKRWVSGVKAYGSDLTGYREYLVNHEFGHFLGYNHVTCPGRGRKAPVMMQQTKGVGACRPNAWPTATR
jgi:ssRNA-specific RNase YbeY (16S rRNA maturation enzyme)